MSKPTEGRPYKKDITYTDPQMNVKDYGIPKCTDKKTSGMEEVVRTKDNTRPFPRV